MAGAATDRLVWTGSANDGDWDNATNWATASGSPTTTTPSAGEGVIMDDRSAWPITQAPSSGVSLDNFTITAACSVGIGTSGTSLTNVTVDNGSAALFTIAGTAHYYFNGNCDTIEINNTGTGGFHYTGGTVAEMNNFGGSATIQSGAAVTALYSARSTFFESGSSAAAVTVLAGVVKTYDSVTSAAIRAGMLQLLGSAGSSGTITVSGGRLNLQTDGTVTAISGIGGQVDALGSRRAHPTITTADYWQPAHNLVKAYEGGTIVVTNDNPRGVPSSSGGAQNPAGL